MNAFEAALNGLTEARLVSVQWLASGQDLAFSVTSSAGHVRVLCRGVTGLVLDLNYRRNSGGEPLACQCDVERTLTKRWAFHWTFPPHGLISLECADLQLEVGAAAPIAARTDDRPASERAAD
jgi:hypothetical protein